MQVLLLGTFGSVGEHTVTAYVNDGNEVKTIHRTISVVEPNVVKEVQDSLISTVVMLIPAALNPFNSPIEISLYLPQAENSNLSIYNLMGKKVTDLASGKFSEEKNVLTRKPESLPTGF